MALVLGATGGIGGEIARLLILRGWGVRALHRDASHQVEPLGVLWMQGDALKAADVTAAAEGMGVIVHAVNPPGYRKWDEFALPMLASTIAAARATGARIVLPGTIYNYGPDAFPVLSEISPQHPETQKGHVRAMMERRLRAASDEGVKSLIVRAGDFFGPHVKNSWFTQAMIKPGRKISRVVNPGAPGVGHTWAYLPDVAETIVQLLEKPRLKTFSMFHMAGHWDADGTEMTAAIARVIGKPKLKAKPFSWGMTRLLSPVVPLFREIQEIRPFWEQPIQLDNSRLVATLGAEPHTPLDTAMRMTLEGLKCL